MSTYGWKVTKCETRHDLLSQEETTAPNGGVQVTPNDGSDVLGDDKVCTDEDISYNHACTPIKSRWILPFLNDEYPQLQRAP